MGQPSSHPVSLLYSCSSVRDFCANQQTASATLLSVGALLSDFIEKFHREGEFGGDKTNTSEGAG
jgi:hypothetical protein